MLTEKACTKCHVVRPLEDFHRGGGPGDRTTRCKECTNASDRALYHANREKAVARVTAYNKAHPEKHAANQTAYRRRHPNKQRAHSAVAAAVHKGLLVPTPCAHCGSVKSIESHHHSYEPADWLDVIWLCSACHMALHRAPRVTLAVPKLRLA